MNLDKKSKISDAIGNLYRAALFLAREKGEEKVSLDLLKKSYEVFDDEISYRKLAGEIKSLLDSSKVFLSDKKKRLIFAEKVLDQYLIMKSQNA